MPIPTPIALIILDGFGYRENPEANAIAAAKKPHWDKLWKAYPHTLISACGEAVGLPQGQMGNSEVGHLTMGAGRIVNQELTRIDRTIQDKTFFQHSVLVEAINQAKSQNKAIHLLGLLSPGGVHSHEKHLYALLQLAREQKMEKIYIHAFLDGRDTPPRSAIAYIQSLNQEIQKYRSGQIVSLIGRYYAMDRDKRWDRVQKAYDLLTLGKAVYHASDPIAALKQAYENNENDEFVQPTTLHASNAQPITIQDGDIVLFFNFRADRARELTEAFVEKDFQGFSRKKHPKLTSFITFTQYNKNFNLPIVFPPESLQNILGAYLSEQGLRQLRIAETEKYAHVTFFFNGGIEKPFTGEDRILIPSPKVPTYDLQPEMSARELTTRLVEEIKHRHYDVIICNFANPDMLGHTGQFPAVVKAIEVIDECLGRIIEALQSIGGEALITADHGNAEYMFDQNTQQPHTAHTNELVPFLYVGRNAEITKFEGKLSDIAPTILYLIGLSQPKEMTGESLVKLIHR